MPERGWRRQRRRACRPPRPASPAETGRSTRAWNEPPGGPKVSSTTESAGWKPSTTGTRAIRSTGVRATKVGAAARRSWVSTVRTLGPGPTREAVFRAATTGRWTTGRPWRRALWTRNGRVRVRRSAGARRADDPARRPRRLLRLGRAARQALAAGQAGRRRRHRRPRSRGHRVVRGPRLRGPLGHADGRGAAPLPQRRVPERAGSTPTARPAGPSWSCSARSARWSSRCRSTRRSSTSRRPTSPTTRSRRSAPWAAS